MSLYYLHHRGETVGPYPAGRIAAMIDAGEISATDQVCAVGESEWIPADYVRPVVDAPPPPRHDAPHCVRRPLRWLAFVFGPIGVVSLLVFFEVGLGIVFIVLAFLFDLPRYYCGGCGNKVVFTTVQCPSCGRRLLKK